MQAFIKLPRCIEILAVVLSFFLIWEAKAMNFKDTLKIAAGVDSPCNRSFNVLFSEDKQTIKKALDSICDVISPFMPKPVKAILDGKLCNWDYNTKEAEKFFKNVYNAFEKQLKSIPVIMLAIDVLENRYLKTRDTTNARKLIAAYETRYAKDLIKNLVELESFILDGPKITTSNIKKIVRIGLLALESVPQSPFFKKVVEILYRMKPSVALQVIMTMLEQIAYFLKYSHIYTLPDEIISEQDRAYLDYIAYKLIQTSAIHDELAVPLTKAYTVTFRNRRYETAIKRATKRLWPLVRRDRLADSGISSNRFTERLSQHKQGNRDDTLDSNLGTESSGWPLYPYDNPPRVRQVFWERARRKPFVYDPVYDRWSDPNKLIITF